MTRQSQITLRPCWALPSPSGMIPSAAWRYLQRARYNGLSVGKKSPKLPLPLRFFTSSLTSCWLKLANHVPAQGLVPNGQCLRSSDDIPANEECRTFEQSFCQPTSLCQFVNVSFFLTTRSSVVTGAMFACRWSQSSYLANLLTLITGHIQQVLWS